MPDSLQIDNIADVSPNIITAPLDLFPYDAINTIIAVLIFVLGFYINILITKKNKKKELELYKLLIVDWTLSIKNSIKIYIKSLNEFAENIAKNESLNIAQYISNTVNIKRLTDLSLEKMTDTLVVNLSAKDEKESVKKLHNYLLQLDYFSEATPDIWKKYETYCDACDEIRDKWNVAYMALNKLLMERHTHNQSDYTDLEVSFLDHIQTLFTNILLQKKDEMEEIGMTVWNEELIQPSLDLIVSNVEISKSMKCRPIISIIHDLRIVRVMHDSNKRFSEVFIRSGETMQKASDIMFDSVSYFDNHQIKSFWKIK
ncbi:hypothetical protein LJC45_01560 [Alistipes sp. OttesenSCG-928-B03]|nr:hypothetical protein [Alistipes sp. OttesenSCG-928-B03]